MPKLLRSSETAGCGATIELNSKEVVYVSIAQIGVLVLLWDMRGGFFKRIASNFFGPQLYKEKDVYKNARTAHALSLMFPDQGPSLTFKNPVLAAFSNAIWHCSTAAQVCTVLNEAAAKAPQLEQDAEEAALAGAFEAAQNWQPPKRPSELTPATYQVIYSHGVSQQTRLTPDEIDRWAVASNKEAESKFPYHIVRIIDEKGVVVWP